MEDPKRFFRYVIPGLVLMIEVSLYLLFSTHRNFLNFLKACGGNSGFPISVFIVSGGIGFCLANLYHHIYWSKCFRWLVPDHRDLIKDVVIKRKWLELENRRDGKEFEKPNVEDLNKKEAWLISNALWYTKLETSKIIKGAEPAIDRLVDIMHSLGSMFIGSILAIPIWLFAHHELTDGFPSFWEYFRTISLMIIIIWVHLSHYRRLVRDFEITSDIIMSDDLQKEYAEKNQTPKTLYIQQVDLIGLRNVHKKLKIPSILIYVGSSLAIVLSLIYLSVLY